MSSQPAGAPIISGRAPAPDAAAIVRQGLTEFNDEYARDNAAQRGFETAIHELEVFLLGADGAVGGGLLGYTQWGWLHVQTLWVAPRYRGQDYGRALLVWAEQEAQRRGCVRSGLATYSFQARGFYEKLGYRLWGTLDDYPPGYTTYALHKQLTRP